MTNINVLDPANKNPLSVSCVPEEYSFFAAYWCLMVSVLILSLSCWASGTAAVQAAEQTIVTVNQAEALVEKTASGNGAARLEQAKYYLATDNEYRDTKKAAKLLRQVVADSVKDQGSYVLQAMLLLQEMQQEVRSEYPEISDDEYDNAHRSVGTALFVKGDKRCVDALLREASLLSTGAQINLNILYKYPIEGYQQFDPRILQLYHEIAVEGLPRWKFYLGEIYLEGLGVESDPDKGIQYLEDSQLGEAYMMLAEYYYLQQDDHHAEQYFTKAAEQDVPEAIYNLGVYAQEKKKYSEAANYFKKTIVLAPDYNAARLELARMYMHGWGILKEEQTGFQMMKDVADNETEDSRLRALAEANVGLFYLRGQGVKQSKVKAEHYLQQAIQSGDEGILNLLHTIVEAKEPHADFIEAIIQNELSVEKQ